MCRDNFLPEDRIKRCFKGMAKFYNTKEVFHSFLFSIRCGFGYLEEKEMALLLGINHNTYRKWTVGRSERLPSKVNVLKIKNFLVRYRLTEAVKLFNKILQRKSVRHFPPGFDYIEFINSSKSSKFKEAWKRAEREFYFESFN